MTTKGSVTVDAELLALRFECGFRRDSLPTIGLEEELILVDPTSFAQADAIESILVSLADDKRFKPELRACQLEHVTPVCLTVSDAHRELARSRRDLVEALDGRVRLMAVGTHPTSIGPIAITPRPRYLELAAENPWFVRCGIPSALHVHVAVTDPDEALAVYNAARSYLPELAALAANSPFFEGRDTGLASSRLKLCEDSPRAGVPPAFGSWRELAAFVAWGSHGGLFDDLGDLWWDLRPRPDLATLEFRIADSQTSLAHAAAIAAVCQSLVVALQTRIRDGEQIAVHSTHIINENRWRALRSGLDGKLVDPDTGVPEPTRERLGRLLNELEPHARELSCANELDHAWSIVRHGGGANEQREAARELGINGLLEWLADATELLPVPDPAVGATRSGATADPGRRERGGRVRVAR